MQRKSFSRSEILADFKTDITLNKNKTPEEAIETNCSTKGSIQFVKLDIKGQRSERNLFSQTLLKNLESTSSRPKSVDQTEYVESYTPDILRMTQRIFSVLFFSISTRYSFCAIAVFLKLLGHQ